MPTPKQSSPSFRIAAPIAVGLLLLAAWELACRLLDVPTFLFPKPSDIVAVYVNDGAGLMRSAWSTIKVTLEAFVLATLLGTFIAFVFVQSRLVEVCFFPYAVLLQVTPVVAIAPLLIILIDDTKIALVICATFVALFPIISNSILGLRSVDPGLDDLFKMYKAGRVPTLRRLRIPSALPYWFGGLRISSGLALIGAVVAEFVAGTGGQSAGLAYEILLSGFQLNIPRMFAALGLIAAVGVLFFVVMTALTRLAIGSWHESMISGET